MNKSKLEIGLEYEIYIKNIISDKYKNCWLWKDTPKNILLQLNFITDINNNCDDIGCDIICENFNNTFIFIQCKNYSTTGSDNTISIYDLAGFYNFIAETGYDGIVYYSGRLSSQILCRKRKINYINVPLIKNNNIIDFKPRDYQLTAYNQLLTSKRSILSMPCGTGKTFVSFLLSLEYKNIIILTPLISTTEQIHNHFQNYYSKYDNINFILVNSKANRNLNNINSNIKNIISSTYDSCNIINSIIDKLENTLIIIDEYHNLSYNMLTNKTDEINKLLFTNNNFLFMSATPLVLPLENNNIEIFGNNIFELSWNDAIQNKYICDYNFYYPNNEKIIDRINEIKFDKTIIDKTILINKAYYLLESIKITNVKKCIVYLKSLDESNQFMKILNVINIYFELKIKSYEINYETTKILRNKYLNKFINDNTSINLILNVHIFDEGIDIPQCDSIYLTHPNNNIQNIIQRISRANRLDVNNVDKIAKVFIWSKDKIKLENIISNISKIIKVKYGAENNDFINYNNEHNISINNNNNNKINSNILIDELIKKSIQFVIDKKTNKPYFHGKQLCLMLGYNDFKDVMKTSIDKKNICYLKDIDCNYKTLYKNVQGHTKYINEQGIYHLISKSKKKNAKEISELISNMIFS